jgi:hypothetical protein
MLYDILDGPPEPGSLLESVLMVLSKRRMEAVYFSNRMLAHAVLAPHTGGDGLKDAMEEYTNSMFPFLAEHRTERERLAKEALDQWTSKKALVVKPMFRPVDRKKFVSRLKRGRENLEKAEELRRRMKHRRI